MLGCDPECDFSQRFSYFTSIYFLLDEWHFDLKNQILYIENVDIVDATPLLDIKPYVAEFDQPVAVRTGWLEEGRKTVDKKKSDKRFVKEPPLWKQLES